MNATTPNPVEHAMVLIDLCGDNLEQARAIADMNWEFASTEKDLFYWLRVARVLRPEIGMVN